MHPNFYIKSLTLPFILTFVQASSYIAFITDSIHSSTPKYLNAHQTTSRMCKCCVTYLLTYTYLLTKKTVQIHTAFPILQRHSAHPSHHHPLLSLQTFQICFLQRPGFSPICQCTLEYVAPRAVRIGDNSLNFAQAHLTLTLAVSSTLPPPTLPPPSVSPK